jgi:hypothetical protein
MKISGSLTIRDSPPIQYYRILQDDEMPFYTNRDETAKILSGAPAVFRLEEHLPILLNRARQEFWFNLNRSDNWSADYKAFLNYTEAHKAFTNNNGIYDNNRQIRRDYVGGTGATLRDPKVYPLVCARNVLCGVEVKLSARVGELKPGTWALRVETVTTGAKVTHATHPHLIHIATNIMFYKYAPNGLLQVNAFPERGGREGYPVYYPVWTGAAPIYYPMNMLDKLKIGDPLPSVYNPQ